MPDYYRFIDRLRSVPGRLRALPDQVRSLPTFLRGLPAQSHNLPARIRDALAMGTFPIRQICLGLAAFALVVFAQRVASRQRSGERPASGFFGVEASKTPAEARGRWITATSGVTQNWDHGTGVYQGSGHGTSQIYQFNADGTYSYFVYMEVRTNFSWVQMNNSCRGTVDFAGDRFSLHPTTGHISATGTSYVDREINAEDLARWTDTCRWRREDGTDATPRLIVTSEKSGKHETSEFKELKD